ncbi:hypothetical protein ACIBHX_47085 [Nonomuraea sp. NPDC050536]|uniref:hypothetical protein n=1 Tax=Nonomuraea sp. NPDC050536 TaxID=3364366 RepID=UPI0037C5FB2D
MQQPDALISTQDGHAIARCKACGRTGRLEFTITTTTRAYLGRPSSTQTVELNGRTAYISAQQPLDRLLYREAAHDCPPRQLTVNRVRGLYVADKPCSPRCMGAAGPNCECSCSGKNHGGSYSAW